MITAKLSTKNQAVVPQTIRDLLGVGPGDEIEYRIDGGQITVRNAKRQVPGRYDTVDLISRITPENIPNQSFDDGPAGEELI